MNRFDVAEQVVFGHLNKSHSTTFQYIQDCEAFEVRATQGYHNRIIEQNEDGSLRMVTEVQDFLIPTSEFVRQCRRLPGKGDKLQRQVNGKTFVWEVIRRDGKHWYEPQGSNNLSLRVTTNLIDGE